MTHKAHATNSLFRQNLYFSGKTETEDDKLTAWPPAQIHSTQKVGQSDSYAQGTMFELRHTQKNAF